MRESADNLREALRTRLRERLSQLRMTQKELAEKTGDDYQQLNRWLSGMTDNIPADFLTRYVTAVPVNARWLLTGEEHPDDLGRTEAQQLLDEIRQLLLPEAAVYQRIKELVTTPAEDALRVARAAREAERGRQPKPPADERG